MHLVSAKSGVLPGHHPTASTVVIGRTWQLLGIMWSHHVILLLVPTPTYGDFDIQYVRKEAPGHSIFNDPA